MRSGVLFFLILFVSNCFSQQLIDKNIERLIAVYSQEKDIECEITVDIEVEGMEIPQKIITVNFEEGKKPKVKGKGLALLPKKGMVNQFNELFNTPLQAIKMNESEGELSYKLVSLDNSSEWVTADIVFNVSTLRISESVINTRKHGAVKASHTFKDEFLPTSSVITFDVKKFKVPLRFIGRQNQAMDLPKNDEEVEGKIKLQYKYLNN